MTFFKSPGLAFFCAVVIYTSLTSGCKKPYNPPVTQASNSYLVVEGIINSGNDSTIIKITRTINLNQTVPDSVTGAVVTVEDNQNGSAALSEKNKGVYISPKLNIDKAKQYRLRVKTADNKVYLSDFVPVQTTPPIDSVGFTIKNSGTNGLQVYVNTHDATNSVQYYRWEYSEAWQFHSHFDSNAIDTRDTTPAGVVEYRVVQRLQYQDIYTCFNSDASSDIALGSSAGLKQAVLNQSPVAFIPSTSEKIEMRYSILVKQYALTAAAYNFYQNLKKNTEQLGSIFDALPSEIQGNIHCISNPAEPVIGYLSVNNTTSKRVFISNSALPQTWVAAYPVACILSPKPSLKPPPTLEELYFDEPGVFEFVDLGEDLSTPICVDCTIRGKHNPPPFWVY